ncbi:MAG: asparagine synthase (glutamine-hydrolyzing), partial [Pirellulaceae bacterium]
PTQLGEIGRAMSRRLSHRGPDDYGWMCSRNRVAIYGRESQPYQAAEVMLLHRRLSILDLSEAGRQPMASTDGRFHIVYNGEIYNYVELRDELSKLGYSFQTKTDTEVLLIGYQHWGAEVLQRLVGMFAFGVLDLERRELFIARDFFGIKPLFYTVTASGFAFASEIKSLLEIPAVKRKVDPQAAFWYLDSGLTDDADGTFIDGVKRLPAAHYALIDIDHPRREIETIEYWRIDPDKRSEVSFGEATERLREMFLDSIKIHLRSDVRVGTALSGGIDSSSIVMAARHLSADNLDFHSFSFIADDPKVSEEKWVDIVGTASRATVHKISIRPEELVADLDDLISTQDEPFCSTSVYAQYRVFRQVRESGVKVMLDGQGADELMAGYKSYMGIRLQSLLSAGRYGEALMFFCRAMKARDIGGYRIFSDAIRSQFPAVLQRPLIYLQALASRCLRRRQVSVERPWLNHQWFEQQNVPLALASDARFNNTLHGKLVECIVRSSLPMLLRFEDRNSMAHGVESRVPFLTPQIVQFVMSLPENYLLNHRGVGKHVFREAMRGITPNTILDRKDKIGFETPEREWLGVLRPWVERVMHSDAAGSIPAINQAAVVAECNEILDGKKKFHPRMWRWLNLIRWADQLNVAF